LAKDKPFEFLDHAIRCGDSLVGITNLDQLRHFSLDPEGPKSVRYRGVIKDEVVAAVDDRLKIERMPVHSVEDVNRQEELLKQSEERLRPLRHAADLLVAASFWKTTPTDREEWTRHFAVAANQHFDSKAFDELEALANKERRDQSMFHWSLEFPEVVAERGGFDGIIGNPPFVTGTSISTILGSPYREYLKVVWPHFQGRADLCVAFFLRASMLLREPGAAGFIGTDTVSEGDSRITGPAHLIAKGFTIFRAIKREKWPGKAAVKICHCHFVRGSWKGAFTLNNALVTGIDSAFDSAVQGEEPKVLQQTRSMSFTGTKVYGNGFVLGLDEGKQIIDADARNKRVVRPYFVGRELNEVNCKPGRFIIDFTGMGRDEAESYPLAWRIVDERVREQRQTAPEKKMREVFWQFQRPRKELYSLLKKRGNAWVIAATSDTVAFVAIEYSEQAPVIFSHAVNVLALEGYGQFAVVQSTIHLVWARRYGSSMKGDMRYTTTDCFETFPLPTDCSFLEAPGRRYYLHRAACAEQRGIGLTDLYRLMHLSSDESEDIVTLRNLHVALDQHVVHAYGWERLNLEHGFHETQQGIRFTISESARREVLGRLLQLNQERYSVEVAEVSNASSAERHQLEPDKPKPKKTKKKQQAGGPDVFAAEEEA
jgi:hypothetical protein